MDELKLIESIRERTALYDKAHLKHSNRDYIQHQWEEVACEIGATVDVPELKRKWSYLRDYFRKLRKRIQNAKPGRGWEKKIKWPLYNSMAFLIPFSDVSETAGNLDVDTYENYDGASLADSDTPETEADTEGFVVSLKHSPSSPYSQDEEQITISQGDPAERAFKPSSAEITTPRMSSPANGKRKRKEDFDTEVLKALKRPCEDVDDDHDHFFKSLRPLLNTLDAFDTMRFRQDVQSVLLRYAEKAKAPSTFSHNKPE
ncbi:transcription factor Adf-1 [Elysia marginata]|uniref:Transcription factor Adf-1 n=1 Tax=Elysia marginata TaxID=1093978 RepID=A0AAV4IQ49_9GAST|nr:transcription factor Adf-1 [Elysia marginata]